MFDGLSYTGRQWVLRQVCPDAVKQLKYTKPDWPERLLRQIVAREIDMDASLRNTLPDPTTIIDMPQAIERLVQAVINKENIVIYADYDVDGTSSAALLKRYFKDVCGRDIFVYIPHRMNEGYGPNTLALQNLAADGVTCVVMVDCGTNACAAINPVADQLDIIVVDHHKVEGEQPRVYALVNPHRDDATPLLRELCACGLTFLLIVGLHRALKATGQYPEVDLRIYLDLVALATVCDVMPLRGLNRVYVRHGLEVLNRREHAGLHALCLEAGIADETTLTAYHLGYMLGPRINAAGRMDHAKAAVELLSGDVEQASTLNVWNQRRQALEKSVLEEAYDQVKNDHSVILVGGEDWHPGLIGIVAGRIKERYHKPSCAISWRNGLGKGSGRSMPGFDLGGIIHQAVALGLLRKGGGHAMAVGFEVEQDRFHAFDVFVQEKAPFMQSAPTLTVDEVLGAGGITPRLLEEWRALEPFGAGNPIPRLVVPHIRLAYASRVGIQHVRTRWVDDSGNVLHAMCWQVADEQLGQFLLQNHAKRPVCHVLGTAQWNDYSQNMQLHIEDIMLL